MFHCVSSYDEPYFLEGEHYHVGKWKHISEIKEPEQTPDEIWDSLSDEEKIELISKRNA